MEKVKQPKLEVVRLENIKTYRAQTEKGTIMVLPRVKDYGDIVQWEVRGYKKGAMGVFAVDEDFIEAIDAPMTWLSEAQALKEALQSQYPMLAPQIIQKAKELENREIKMLEAAKDAP